MINPVNLIKIDNIRDSDGKTFHIGELPEYDQESYDLSNPKDYERYIKDVKAEVRGSFEYREMVKYLREYGGMNRSGLSPNISNTDNNHVKIEIHHTPFVIEDIVRIIVEKRRSLHQDLSIEMVAKEVMQCHYQCIVGLYPLSATEHELVHSGYLFIPPEDVFGNYEGFIEKYKDYIDSEDKDTIEEIEGHAQSFDPSDQNKLLSQSSIYLDPNGAYQVPQLTDLGQAMSGRIDTIRNNMYYLPVLQEEQLSAAQNAKPALKEAIYFVNEEGERINEPVSEFIRGNGNRE